MIRAALCLSLLLAACATDTQRDEVPDDCALLTGDALAAAQLVSDVDFPEGARVWLGPAIDEESEVEVEIEVEKVCASLTKHWNAVRFAYPGFLCLNGTCTPKSTSRRSRAKRRTRPARPRAIRSACATAATDPLAQLVAGPCAGANSVAPRVFLHGARPSARPRPGKGRS